MSSKVLDRLQFMNDLVNALTSIELDELTEEELESARKICDRLLVYLYPEKDTEMTPSPGTDPFGFAVAIIETGGEMLRELPSVRSPEELQALSEVVASLKDRWRVIRSESEV